MHQPLRSTLGVPVNCGLASLVHSPLLTRSYTPNMSLTNSGASSGGTQTIAATNLSSTTFQQSQPSQMIQQQSQTAPTVATATVVTPQSQQHLPTSYVGIGLATTYSSSSPTPITLQRTTHHHHHCSAAHPYLRSSQLVAANAASITLPACITVNRGIIKTLTLNY